MTPEQFAYWLQGFFELREDPSAPLSDRQIQVVRDHLALVFMKLTPDRAAVEVSTEPLAEDVVEHILMGYEEAVATLGKEHDFRLFPDSEPPRLVSKEELVENLKDMGLLSEDGKPAHVRALDKHWWRNHRGRSDRTYC